MNDDTFAKNIRRYILRRGNDGDMDVDTDTDMYMDVDIDIDIDSIDSFDITNFDYRKIFNKSLNENINHIEIVSKFFGIETSSEVDTAPQKLKWYFDDHPNEWKELFIFFCVMPFTEYAFQGDDGKLVNPYTLHRTSTSEATENNLIGTFSNIEFESFKQNIPEGRLAVSLQNILETDIFSNSSNEDQRKRIIANLLHIGFESKFKLVKHIRSKAESTYRDNFKQYLFRPISEYVTAILAFEIEVEEDNAEGQTGVHTMVPHQTKNLFCSYPDMVAYAEKVHYQSLALVEVKKLPILIYFNL